MGTARTFAENRFVDVEGGQPAQKKLPIDYAFRKSFHAPASKLWVKRFECFAVFLLRESKLESRLRTTTQSGS